MSRSSLPYNFLLFTTLAFVVVPSLTAQRKPTNQDSARTIITKVPFEGKNYFITLVPIDSSNIDRMPIVGSAPKTRANMIWSDSLNHLLPDSVLRQLLRFDMSPMKLQKKQP